MARRKHFIDVRSDTPFIRAVNAVAIRVYSRDIAQRMIEAGAPSVPIFNAKQGRIVRVTRVS